MNLKDSLLFMAAGILGVFLGYWLLHAADALILKTHESGDLATWFAASGTILTLGFLINQHTQLRAEQKKEKEERKVEESKQRKELAEESKKREEHEKKQQKMWAQQNEMLSFEKFQLHRKMFFEELEELESRNNLKGIKFYDKPALYKKLFPSNSFSLTNYETDFWKKNVNRDIEFFIRSLEEATASHDEIVSNYDQLLQSLNITYTPPYSHGQITNIYGDTNLNLFSPDLPLVHFKTIINALLRFSGSNEDCCSNIPSLESKHIRLILSNIKNLDYQYDINLGGIEELFWDLWTTNELLIKCRRARFSKPATNQFALTKTRFICSPSLYLFTSEKLSELEIDLCFRERVVNDFIRAIDDEAQHDSRYQDNLQSCKEALESYQIDE